MPEVAGDGPIVMCPICSEWESYVVALDETSQTYGCLGCFRKFEVRVLGDLTGEQLREAKVKKMTGVEAPRLHLTPTRDEEDIIEGKAFQQE